MVIFLVAAAWLLTVGTLTLNGLLVALSVFALAGALGSSTGYWHASYGLLVREATVTIVAFGCWARWRPTCRLRSSANRTLVSHACLRSSPCCG